MNLVSISKRICFLIREETAYKQQLSEDIWCVASQEKNSTNDNEPYSKDTQSIIPNKHYNLAEIKSQRGIFSENRPFVVRERGVFEMGMLKTLIRGVLIFLYKGKELQEENEAGYVNK